MELSFFFYPSHHCIYASKWIVNLNSPGSRLTGKSQAHFRYLMHVLQITCSHVQFNDFLCLVVQFNLSNLCDASFPSQPRLPQQVAVKNSKLYSARDSAIRMNHRENRLLARYCHNIHAPVGA